MKKTLISLFVSGALLIGQANAEIQIPKEGADYLPTFQDETVLGYVDQFNIYSPELGLSDGFYSFEEYQEKRTQEIEKVNIEDLFKGMIVNTSDGLMLKNQELFMSYMKDLSDFDSLSKQDQVKLQVIQTFSKMTGFALFDEKKELQDTLFLFLDYDTNPSKVDEFLLKTYLAAKENGKNVLVFPVSLGNNNDSFKIGFNNLKVRALTKPEKLNKLNARSYERFFDVKSAERVSKIFFDGIVSNTISLISDIGSNQPIVLVRVDENWERGVITGDEIDFIQDFIKGVSWEELTERFEKLQAELEEKSKGTDKNAVLEPDKVFSTENPPVFESKPESNAKN